MFCLNPDCKHREETGNPAEYVDGVTVCADCGTPLVDELPAPAEPAPEPDELLELERLTAITDPSFGALLRSYLDQAGIAWSTRAEGVQDLFTVGRMGTGYNLLTGPSWLYVERARLAEAREIVAALEEGAAPLDDELAGYEEP